MQLREPVAASPMILDMYDNNKDFEFQIEDLPKASQLRLKSLSLDDFPSGTLMRRGAKERLSLGGEELLVEVEPAGQAQIIERIGTWLNRFEVRGHRPTLAISATLRQWAHGLGGLCSPFAILNDSRRGVPVGYVNDRPKK